MSTDRDKLDKLINLVTSDLKDEEGTGVFKADDLRLASVVPYGIPTQLAQLDLAIGKPGFPVGRIVEVFGFEGSGKTTLALHAIAQSQAMGGSGLFIDTEKTFDPSRAEEIGIDTSNLMVAEADTIEGIFTQLDSVLDNLKSVDYDKTFVVVVDSITGVSTEDERDKSFRDPSKLGEDARAIRRGVRRLNPKIAVAKVLVIFINHAISKIVSFGKQSQAAGGHALKFYSSVRVEVAGIGQIKDGDVRTGQKVKFNVEKVKGAALRRPSFESELHNIDGFDRLGSLLEAFVTIGVVTHKKGSKSYTFVPDNTEFSIAGWPGLVEAKGGFDKFYKFFHDCAVAKGEMSRWGVDA